MIPQLRQILSLNALLALGVGTAGGGLFWLAGLPLPWMLGSLTASAIVSLAGRPWLMPNPLRDLARPVIGLLAGSAFMPAVVATLPQWWPAILVMIAYTLVALALGSLYFIRFAGFDRVTAFFASAPGGLAELTLLGDSLGGDLRKLVTAHAVRIIVVVFVLPITVQILMLGEMPAVAGAPPDHANGSAGIGEWLLLAACGVAGYAIGKTFRVPGGVMIPAMLLSAVVHALGWTAVVPPGWLVSLVQIVIGSAAGGRFYGIHWREMSRTVTHSIVWALILIGCAATIAWVALPFLGQPYVALLLALAPGGTAEMTLIAYAIGIEAAFVITCQVIRIFLVYTLAPFAFRATGGRSLRPPRDRDGPPDP